VDRLPTGPAPCAFHLVRQDEEQQDVHLPRLCSNATRRLGHEDVVHSVTDNPGGADVQAIAYAAHVLLAFAELQTSDRLGVRILNSTIALEDEATRPRRMGCLPRQSC
jgi:hypothetical protein